MTENLFILIFLETNTYNNQSSNPTFLRKALFLPCLVFESILLVLEALDGFVGFRFFSTIEASRIICESLSRAAPRFFSLLQHHGKQ